MKPHRTHSDGHLLHHVVADSAPDDFRAATLDAMLRGARRRRHLRRARAATAALALPALAIALLWLRSPYSPAAPPQGPRELPTPPAKLAAHTPPLRVPTRAHPGLIVASRPLSPETRVATRLLAAEDRLSTDLRLGPLLIDDNELLALAPASSVLIRLPSGGARLLFPDQTPGP